MVIFAISWNDRELKIVGEVFKVNGGYPAAMCDGSQGGIVSSWEIGFEQERWIWSIKTQYNKKKSRCLIVNIIHYNPL